MSSRTDWPTYLKSFPPRNLVFVLNKYALGSIPAEIADELREAILAAKHTPISNDVAEGASLAPLTDEQIAILNRQQTYKEMDRATAVALSKAFEHMKDEVAKLLNSPWRVLNVRSWTTTKGADYGAHTWHTDGDWRDLLKMMIYSTKTGEGLGALQFMTPRIKDISGEAGLWALFYNSTLSHRAIAPAIEGIVRVATEITIAPSREFELKPIALGLAARHSIYP